MSWVIVVTHISLMLLALHAADVLDHVAAHADHFSALSKQSWGTPELRFHETKAHHGVILERSCNRSHNSIAPSPIVWAATTIPFLSMLDPTHAAACQAWADVPARQLPSGSR